MNAGEPVRPDSLAWGNGVNVHGIVDWEIQERMVKVCLSFVGWNEWVIDY